MFPGAAFHLLLATETELSNSVLLSTPMRCGLPAIPITGSASSYSALGAADLALRANMRKPWRYAARGELGGPLASNGPSQQAVGHITRDLK